MRIFLPSRGRIHRRLNKQALDSQDKRIYSRFPDIFNNKNFQLQEKSKIDIDIEVSKWVSYEIEPAHHNHQPTHKQGTK